ncbi:MAG: hypothetical protein U0992_01655 [Planctomycetaceae bacterium]
MPAAWPRLYCDPQLVIGFRHAWQPLPANLLYYAPCFAAGWWLLRQRNRDRAAAWICAAGIVASPLLIAAALPLIHSYAAGTSPAAALGCSSRCLRHPGGCWLWGRCD